MSDKARTNAKWSSSKKHRDNWDRIFSNTAKQSGEEDVQEIERQDTIPRKEKAAHNGDSGKAGRDKGS